MPTPLPWHEHVAGSTPLRALTEALAADLSAVATGVRGALAPLLAAETARTLNRTVLLVVAHLDEADDALDDLESLGREDGWGHLVFERFGALEVLPGETAVNLELLAERIAVVGHAADGKYEGRPGVLVAPVQALMQGVPAPDTLDRFTLTLRAGDTLPPGQLFDWLDRAGYARQDAIEQPGDFANRGGIVDLYPVAGRAMRPPAGPKDKPTPAAISPIRLDYFGDEIESIRRVDPDTMGSGEPLLSVGLIGQPPGDHDAANHTDVHLLELLPPDVIPALHEVQELAEQARGYFERLTRSDGIAPPREVFQTLTGRPHAELNAYSKSTNSRAVVIDLPTAPLAPFDPDAKRAVAELAEMSTDTQRVVALCRQPAEANRLRELLDEFAPGHAVTVRDGVLNRGFVWGADLEDAGATKSSAKRRTGQSLVLVPHHELFHRYETRRRVRRVLSAPAAGGQAGDAFLDLEAGDYVVHVDHGIAKFVGLKTMRARKQAGGSPAPEGAPSHGGGEYLALQFADQVKLNVPAAQIDLIQKYVGGFEGRPPLSKLGGKKWKRQKDQVADAVKDLAAQLLRVQAARAVQPGIRYPADTKWQTEFEAEFPFNETEDQLAAIAAVKADMADDTPMDRLICGDVGFGKTEVAIRAAFKACEYGKQVAVLVPTTVLAEQHERNFARRFADYPFNVAALSRFRTPSQVRATLKGLATGGVDVVIGTHRLLSKDIAFADLGLVVIDEEQRFGVEHKNKLLELRLTADVMTLTATPIPRTLHMSMVGLRDISSLTTAPVDRRAIVTEVVPWDERRVKQALIRELSREGQAYFVHNRVHSIHERAAEIQALVPDAKILVGHGQMGGHELEKVMLAFTRREADILVSTTIIESGIDIPTANTMFIDQADHFGLAELHQLRGRVGRSRHRAYCYLLLPPDRTVNEVAAKRLKAIENYSMLGAGFKIAMRDLEIRGAGNILGGEQSGHIAAVGYEMYCLLLEQETKRLNHEPVIEASKCHLDLPGVSGEGGGAAGSLPKRWIPGDKHRMDAYRRLTRVDTLIELDAVVEDLTEACGKPPAPAQSFIDLTEIRVAASTLRIDRIRRDGADLIFNTAQPHAVMPLFADAPGRTLLIDTHDVYWRPPPKYLEDPTTIAAVLRKLLVRPVRGRADRVAKSTAG